MEKNMLSSNGTITNALSFTSLTKNAAMGKLYVPVSKSALLYSHFDHVSGVAVENDQQGVSISKIRILNSLIDRLSVIQNKAKESITDISEDQAQELIEQYQNEIEQTVSQQIYKPADVQSMTGELFALDA